eukprot:657693-Pleurochrysis_carterae.AAC.1
MHTRTHAHPHTHTHAHTHAHAHTHTACTCARHGRPKTFSNEDTNSHAHVHTLQAKRKRICAQGAVEQLQARALSACARADRLRLPSRRRRTASTST